MDRHALGCFASSGQRPTAPARSRRSPIVVAGLTAIALLLAACGGGAADASHSSTTGSRSTAAESSAVIAAYRAGWNAFQNALADANPSDPLLTETMVDPQLQGVKANLLADQRQGIVGRGTFTLHPKIVSMSATKATIVDCAYSTAALVYASTGKPVPPVTPPV